MIAGTVYGVALNDTGQRAALADAFVDAPYKRPPSSPVVYIKTRNCIRRGEVMVAVPRDLAEVGIGATIALLFDSAPNVPVAAALAIDLFEPHESYYRPAIRQYCRDGFLPIGDFVAYDEALVGGEIATAINGVAAHRWNPGRRLHRAPAALARELGRFMTLADGDVLLIGLPGDAPRARVGSTVHVTHSAMPPLTIHLKAEDHA